MLQFMQKYCSVLPCEAITPGRLFNWTNRHFICCNEERVDVEGRFAKNVFISKRIATLLKPFTRKI